MWSYWFDIWWCISRRHEILADISKKIKFSISQLFHVNCWGKIAKCWHLLITELLFSLCSRHVCCYLHIISKGRSIGIFIFRVHLLHLMGPPRCKGVSACAVIPQRLFFINNICEPIYFCNDCFIYGVNQKLMGDNSMCQHPARNVIQMLGLLRS